MQKVNRAWYRNVRIYRSRDVPWRRVQKRGGPSLQRIHLLGARAGRGVGTHGTTSKVWETNLMRVSKERQMKRGSGVAREQQDWQGSYGRNPNDFSCRKSSMRVCGDHLAAFVSHQRTQLLLLCSAPSRGGPHAGGDNAKVANMLVRSENHDRWKHPWRWHTRGCVWDDLGMGCREGR